MKEQILSILKEMNPYDEIMETSSLIDDGILDSLRLVLFIQALESHFHVQVPEEKLQPEQFENIPKIVRLIEELSKD